MIIRTESGGLSVENGQHSADQCCNYRGKFHLARINSGEFSGIWSDGDYKFGRHLKLGARWKCPTSGVRQGRR